MTQGTDWRAWSIKTMEIKTMKYIPAEKLIAEIERLKEKAQAERVLHPQTILSAKNYLLIKDYDTLLSFITSLQQEQPEVDLEKAIESYSIALVDHQASWDELDKFARHFYNLGLNARKK